MSWLEQLRTVDWSQASLVGLGAYALGCFTTGYYLVRACRGTDIRAEASGSVGARNVGRVLGRPGFLLTTLGDALKGAVAVWVTQKFFPDARLALLALLAVVAGHIWPAQLRFRGGKGVATSLGAISLYDWRLAVVYAAVFLGGLVVVRKSTLPGLFAFLCLPPAAFWLNRNWPELAAFTVLAALVLFAHRANLAEELPGFATGRPPSRKTPSPEP
jgi:glycerol-3-phosphate acyltransferase PlsY